MTKGHRYYIILVVMSFLCGSQVFAQISPGELAKVHSHLEGMSNCTKCHILGEKVSNTKCLDCHTELKSRISLGKGFHSSQEIKGKECVTCHSDHHGLNFQIVRFDKDKFNHNLTGYVLQGAHAKKLCIDCHKAGFISDPKIKKKKFTYLGLNTACLNCHPDYHQQTLPGDCGSCHDFGAFIPASKFDHKRAKFQLTGKHQTVACTACHKVETRNDKKFQVFTGLKYDNCSACHQDPHQNKFGQNCAQCHSDVSFSVIKSVSSFDHNKTHFRLEGRHQTVDCKGCHKSAYTNKLKYARCTDCHSDYHTGQFAKQGVSPDCSSCHSVNGFAESSFSAERHNLGTFRLEGAHLATPCIACHKKTGKWDFLIAGGKCVDCHEDIHKPGLSEKYYPGEDCRICHTVNRWNTVGFDHAKTGFELTGAHSAKTCRDCHFKNEASGTVKRQFTGLTPACSACHQDVHAGQFETGGTTDCRRCHATSTFVPAPGFDHSKTLFPLDGKHINVACNKCHKVVTEQGKAYVLYKIKEFKCENCHH